MVNAERDIGRVHDDRRSMFRAMKACADGLPRVGRSARELGVRVEGPNPDIPLGQEGMVEPRTGGMSVALGAARNLPKPRLPRALGGEGRDPVFTMLAADVPGSLVVRPERHPHALVEPVRTCPLSDFESALAGTRSGWSQVP